MSISLPDPIRSKVVDASMVLSYLILFLSYLVTSKDLLTSI